jgi:carbamoyl-phosphate synthase small subunit
MTFGHHGVNHPVKSLDGDRIEITSQNHNYAVAIDNLPGVRVTHVNLNDNVIEGLEIEKANAISVQYHPESAPGPHDSKYIFDKFKQMML